MSEQRVAVITGGTGGLGRALLPLLARRGYRMAVTYIIPEEAAVLEKELHLDGTSLILRRVDATDADAVGAFMEEIASRMGGIHVVASLVGGWAGGRDVEETDDTRFDRMLDLNLRSAFVTVRAAVPHLRKAGWGRIILVGSTAATEAPAGQAAYNVAKAGVVALARTLAQELRGTGVTANAVLPSVIDTPATRAAMPYANGGGIPVAGNS